MASFCTTAASEFRRHIFLRRTCLGTSLRSCWTPSPTRLPDWHRDLQALPGPAVTASVAAGPGAVILVLQCHGGSRRGPDRIRAELEPRSHVKLLRHDAGGSSPTRLSTVTQAAGQFASADSESCHGSSPRPGCITTPNLKFATSLATRAVTGGGCSTERPRNACHREAHRCRRSDSKQLEVPEQQPPSQWPRARDSMVHRGRYGLSESGVRKPVHRLAT
jgi:hypothetical protein